MNLTPRDRKVILFGAVVVAALLGGNFVLLPWVDDWQRARGRITEARATLANWEARQQREALQRQRLGELFGHGLAAALPAADEARVGFPNTIEPLMKRAGVTVTSIHPQPARALRDLEGLTLVSIQVEAQCDLSQLARCLAELAAAEQLVLADRVSATAVPNRPGRVSVSMLLSTPARREAAP